jgi:hypothetical protein
LLGFVREATISGHYDWPCVTKDTDGLPIVIKKRIDLVLKHALTLGGLQGARLDEEWQLLRDWTTNDVEIATENEVDALRQELYNSDKKYTDKIVKLKASQASILKAAKLADLPGKLSVEKKKNESLKKQLTVQNNAHKQATKDNTKAIQKLESAVSKLQKQLKDAIASRDEKDEGTPCCFAHLLTFLLL